MVSNRKTEEARAITERLLKVSSQAGKVLQAVLAIEESRDTTSFQRLINEGISEGYLLSSVVLARRYSFDKKEDAAVKVWESIADRVPLVCSYIGEYYQKQNNIKKSTEYYKKADQWACLSIKGAGFLLDDILYRQGKFSIRDKKEENRLRQIRDGKDR